MVADKLPASLLAPRQLLDVHHRLPCAVATIPLSWSGPREARARGPVRHFLRA
jgi:hypothetical protein